MNLFNEETVCETLVSSLQAFPSQPAYGIVTLGVARLPGGAQSVSPSQLRTIVTDFSSVVDDQIEAPIDVDSVNNEIIEVSYMESSLSAGGPIFLVALLPDLVGLFAFLLNWAILCF